MGQTWMITDNDSTTKIPDEISRGKNIPVHEAIAANPPPSAKDPIWPINIEALYLLCRRNPTQDPAIEAPNIARSGLACSGKEKRKRYISSKSPLYGNIHTTYIYIVLKMTIFCIMIQIGKLVWQHR